MRTTPILECENLTFCYPRQTEPAIREITAAVHEAEFVVLCGASGSGKTTLLRHWKKNQIPFGTGSGALRYRGQDLERMDDRVSAAAIGYVGQHPDAQLVTDRVWHELAFGLENLGVPGAEIRRRTAEIAQYFGMEGWFRKPVSVLSGGQKQMLNLASVMILQPEVLLLDEPTAQLDPIGSRRFLDTLQRLNRDFGTAVLLSEQRLEEVVPLADRVLILHRGRLAGDCRPANLAQVMACFREDTGEELPVASAMPTAIRVWRRVKGDLSQEGGVRDCGAEGMEADVTNRGAEKSAQAGKELVQERKSGSAEESAQTGKALAQERKSRSAEKSAQTGKALAQERKSGSAEKSAQAGKALAQERKSGSAEKLAQDDADLPVSIREGRAWLARSVHEMGQNISGTAQKTVRNPAPEENASAGDAAETHREHMHARRRAAKPEIVLSAAQVAFSYEKGMPVLRDFSIEVARGQCFAILGGNGSGKSTALKVLQGIYRASRGRVQAKGTVRYLAQDPRSLFTELTVEEELWEIWEGQGTRTPDREERKRRVEEMLAMLGLEETRTQNPMDLSGGQQQRLALGKVLLTAPDILLLDEPTKGLDGAWKTSLASLLHQLCVQGKTVLLVSHDIEFCAQYADACGLLFDGALISRGSCRSFFQDNFFYTTAAGRLAQGILPDCFQEEDIVHALQHAFQKNGKGGCT